MIVVCKKGITHRAKFVEINYLTATLHVVCDYENCLNFDSNDCDVAGELFLYLFQSE